MSTVCEHCIPLSWLDAYLARPYSCFRFLEVSNLVAEQPFDEDVFQRAVDAVSRDVDNADDDDDDNDAAPIDVSTQPKQQQPTGARTFA